MGKGTLSMSRLVHAASFWAIWKASAWLCDVARVIRSAPMTASMRNSCRWWSVRIRMCSLSMTGLSGW